jgi:Family of unknown function (DUF5923)
LNLAIAELRTLLERFANYKSLDVIIDAIDALIDDTDRDEGLREWFMSIDVYIRKVFSPLYYYIYVLIRYLKQVLLDPGFVLESTCNTEGNRLRETGQHFYGDKYRDHFDNLFNSVGGWFKAMGEDPVRHYIPSSHFCYLLSLFA